MVMSWVRLLTAEFNALKDEVMEKAKPEESEIPADKVAPPPFY